VCSWGPVVCGWELVRLEEMVVVDMVCYEWISRLISCFSSVVIC